jgi:two-component system, cell cycle sensor histidine kinase and response regulator CckA
MKEGPPSFDDIFVVMSAASVGDTEARVSLPDWPQLDDTATKFAIALNILLDDLAVSAADVQHELAARGHLANRLQVLAEASHEFAAATYDLDRLLYAVARRLCELVGDVCVIRAVTEDGQWLESRGAAYHRDPALLAEAREVMTLVRQRVGEGVAGRAAATGKPVLVPKIDTDELPPSTDPRYRAYLERLGLTSSMALPLVCRGKVVGVASLMRNSPGRPYTEDDLSLVQSVADHAALAIGNARSYAAERVARDAADRAASALQQAKAQFARLSECGIIGIMIADVHGNILEANDTYLKMLGYSRDELVQGVVRWSDLTPPELKHLGDRATELLRASGVAPPFETESFRKDGTRISVLVGIAMLEYPRCIAFMADLTQRVQAEAGRKRAEEALRQSEDQLRQAQKMEAVGRLAGGIAHDFNNVLSVILSYSDLLLSDLQPGDPMRDDVLEIQKAGTHAADLTRQLLMFSRQQVLEPKVVDLNDVIARMDKMLHRVVGEDVELLFIRSTSIGKVRVDPGSIEQVIMNLVVNARDAMPVGGKLTIETANAVLDEAYAAEHLGVKPGPHVLLAVSDSGSGMDRATQARIFEPFFTTKPIGQGTGLGLSTVFGIVQQSGGSVWVYSEVGKGTSFKVYLPLVEGAVDEAEPRSARATLRGSETILLVEDEAQVRAVALGILRRQGYRVLVAANGGEALLLCEKHSGMIDLLLSDVVMPQMSGPELARRLATLRPTTRVLCMSGYTDDAVIRHVALEAGIAFIQKPFTPDTLARKVREVLDAHRS